MNGVALYCNLTLICIAIATAGAWVGWVFSERRIDRFCDDAYDKGYRACESDLGAHGVPRRLLADAGPPVAPRPGRHGRGRCNWQSRTDGQAGLPGHGGSGNIGRKTS